MKNFSYSDYLITAKNSCNPELVKAANEEIEQLRQQMLNQEKTIREMAERHRESMEAAERRFEKMKQDTIATHNRQPGIFERVASGAGHVIGAFAGGIARGWKAIFG